MATTVHKLLDAVTANTTGAAKRCRGPISIFVEGGLGGGTLQIQAARVDSTGEAAHTDWGVVQEVIGSPPAPSRFNVLVYGDYFLRAVLSGATNASLTVASN